MSLTIPPIDTPERFASYFDVPRETVERLEIYETLLRRWQKNINLVAPGTLDHLWRRHFADSAQLLALAPEARKWLDLGSGAGFPGLVIAICCANREDVHIHIVESNARKCAFMKEVVRETGCSVEIHNARIESLGHLNRFDGVEIVTARALAPLGELFRLSSAFLKPGTRAMFLKGRQAADELAEASNDWSFKAQLHPSVTDDLAAIVQVTNLQETGPEHVEAASE